MRWFLVSWCIATISIGCAGADGWQRLNMVPPQDVAESARVAVGTAKLTPVNLRRRSDLNLAPSDGVVMLGSSRSYFKVVSLFINGPRSIQIQIASECDCVGFRKFILVPLVAVFDSDGQDVAVSGPKLRSKQADMSNPLRLVATWTLLVQTTGTYRILVAADNSQVGSSVATARGSGLGLLPSLVAIDVKAASVGKFSFLATPSP